LLAAGFKLNHKRGLGIATSVESAFAVYHGIICSCLAASQTSHRHPEDKVLVHTLTSPLWQLSDRCTVLLKVGQAVLCDLHQTLHLLGPSGTDLAQTSKYYTSVPLHLISASYKTDTRCTSACMHPYGMVALHVDSAHEQWHVSGNLGCIGMS